MLFILSTVRVINILLFTWYKTMNVLQENRELNYFIIHQSMDDLRLSVLLPFFSVCSKP
jgi:hypothetical protein